jgi:glycosyltransferase involved in cell wall biosynthesis
LAAFRFLPTGTLAWIDPRYSQAVGPAALVRYVRRLARYSGEPLGSRRVALGYLLWYRRFLRTVRPCLVHMQHPLERHLYTWLVSRYEGWRLPLVVTVHSIFKEHSDESIEKIIRPNLQRADRLIVVSRTTADEAEQLGADPSKCRLIRTGVDLERFRPCDRLAARARLGVDPDLPLVLFVGNLEPRKAVDRLLLALSDVRRVVHGATLAIVGTGASAGADDQEPRLRRMVTEMGLGSAVWFLGHVPRDKLPAWYAAADVFALPSSSEAQGMVVLEAMASGLPVVASAVGGLLDTVEEDRTGYLVPFGDVPQLADRLASLLVDPSRRARMGAAAHEVAVRDFSWQNVVKATIEVYCEALAESRIPYSAA